VGEGDISRAPAVGEEVTSDTEARKVLAGNVMVRDLKPVLPVMVKDIKLVFTAMVAVKSIYEKHIK